VRHCKACRRILFKETDEDYFAGGILDIDLDDLSDLW
jgi:hypothetical protein